MHRVQIANKGICICSFQRASSGRTYLGWVTPSVTGEGSGDRGVMLFNVCKQPNWVMSRLKTSMFKDWKNQNEHQRVLSRWKAQRDKRCDSSNVAQLIWGTTKRRVKQRFVCAIFFFNFFIETCIISHVLHFRLKELNNSTS